MTNVKDLHKKWMEESEYAKAYADMEAEFASARDAIETHTITRNGRRVTLKTSASSAKFMDEAVAIYRKALKRLAKR